MAADHARAALAGMATAVERLAAVEDAASELLALLDHHDSFRTAMSALPQQDAEDVRLARLKLVKALRRNGG